MRFASTDMPKKASGPRTALLMTVVALYTVTLICGPLAADAVDADLLRAERERIAAIDKASTGVVSIFSVDGKSGGSGVVISADGLALSNFHVVQPCGVVMKCGMSDGRLYDAVLVGVDPTGDVALIKLIGRNDFPFATLGDSDSARLGDEVFAMGNPFMLSTDLKPTVTFGIISGTHRYQFPAGTILEYADCLQTDAAINPGNSGGPLFDHDAQVVGINGRCSFEKRGRVSVGMSYAISINQIKNFLGHLYGGMIVDHATLGATVAFDAGGRVVIDDILEDSDAYRRGLRYGDQIIRFSGRAIDSPNTMKNILGTLPADWRMPLRFRREGRDHDILVRLAAVHSRGKLLEQIKTRPQLPLPPQPKGDQKSDRKPDKTTRPVSDAAPQQLPETVARHFRKKHGYANYHFNLANRRRVLDAWATRTGLQQQRDKKDRLVSSPDDKRDVAAADHWTINVYTRSGKKAVIELQAKTASIRCGDSVHQWSAPRQLGGDAGLLSLDPPDSGGLLAALHFWRQLALLGADGFGDIHYAGVAPVYKHREPGQGQLTDVIIALTADAECRFYFDRRRHDLTAMEMSTSYTADPCEIYFDDYRNHRGKRMPGRIEVRRGEEIFEIFSLDPPSTSTGTTVRHPTQNQDTIIDPNQKPRPRTTSAYSELIRKAQQKVVKIYGAGGFHGLESYQSGLLISSRGHVLTSFSSVLDTDRITVTLDDGQRLEAALVGADPGLEVAVLKVEADGLPFFELDESAALQTGARVLALGNLFGVAVGSEPVSVLRGVVASATRLTAGLGAFETPYHGPAYVLDAATNNPGAAGGALVNRHGRLAGMLDKELKNKLSDTWLNYALPADELKKSVDRILSGRFTAESDAKRKKPAQPLNLTTLGIVLLPDVMSRTPPYVDAVRPGSAAAKADIRADDLIVLLGDRLVRSCKHLQEELSYTPQGDAVHITVMREWKLLHFVIKQENIPGE